MARAICVLALLLGLGCGAPKPAVDPVIQPEAPPPPPPPAEKPPEPPPPSPPAVAAADPKQSEMMKLHGIAAWLPKRAERLGIDLESATARDVSFAAGPPADGLWWDGQLATEVHEVWNGLCRECHQGNRSKEKVLGMPIPDRAWSTTKTRFFKWDQLPKDAYRIILEGQKTTLNTADAKDMPGWANKLSNEQVWGLVYFISTASKKKVSDIK